MNLHWLQKVVQKLGFTTLAGGALLSARIYSFGINS